MRLIVDGYNVARSGTVPLAADPAGPAGRDELCAILAAYAMAKRLRLTVVFDARGAGRPARMAAPFKGGTAVYAASSESADDVIRDFTRNAPSGTVVVTSDRGLAGTLGSRTVTVVSCADFAERLFAHQMETVKGSAGDGDREAHRGTGKKGEGRRLKKKERRREGLLRKL